jgi:hypothetical protein
MFATLVINALFMTTASGVMFALRSGRDLAELRAPVLPSSTDDHDSAQEVRCPLWVSPCGALDS